MCEGEIALKGNPQELQALGRFSATLAELNTKEDTKSDDGSKDKKVDDIEDDGNAERAKAVNDPTSEDEYNSKRLDKLVIDGGLGTDINPASLEGTLVEDEERETGRIKMDVWHIFLSACGGYWYWFAVLLLNSLTKVVAIVQDYWIRIWVEANNTASPPVVLRDSTDTVSPTANTNIVGQHTVSFWIGIYLAIGVIEPAYAYSGLIKAARNVHAKLIRSVVHATPRFFDSTPFGRIINRFSCDMESIGTNTLDSLIWMFADFISALGVIIIITAVTPLFIFVAVVITFAYVVIAKHYLDSTRELKRLESNASAPLLSLFGELIQGVSSIRVFGLKKYYIMEAINRSDELNRPFYLTMVSSRWIFNAGLAGFALVYELQFKDYMLFATRNYGDNELNMNGVERVSQYLKLDQEASAQSMPENKPVSNWPRTGDLEIEDLVVEYVPNVPVLHGLSMSIKHGEKIGVVGRTGAGKSMLSLAFLQFIEAAKGRIVLDRVDISKIGLEDLRRNVTIIPQDPVLFNGTICFNLDPFSEYPDEIVWDALHCAHLTASTAISLVALARALVCRSRLIIMDEATASVDFDTDDRIQRTIRGSEFADSTLFCIAHRLRTIIDYDRVLVLDKGKVAEFDTPANLLNRQGSIFRSMCEKSGEFEYLADAAKRAQDAKQLS
ncbi:P-loop containing nucleoside triphosphate hydrolase protein [Linderina pennispora]|uniref:p-loop containing nucleoside triphosphate hydrolase protein n=1 Tax=Linderina pennispora TaxID=61395 RepID=A0A1Y1W2T2_9FUNG|nr:P-loop containing nucleoside triphosphate hydrolase protein [Linderina pennispora]ORX67692.1 P-loop containing nucleoside triphosphate hydrolase protein [Linderina pennispora]